jgi:hypothetical protein
VTKPPERASIGTAIDVFHSLSKFSDAIRLAFACLALGTVLHRVASVTFSTPLAVSMVAATDANVNSERSMPGNDRTEQVVELITLFSAFTVCIYFESEIVADK